MIVNKTKIQGCAEGSGQEGERGKERKEEEENGEAIWQSGDQKEGKGRKKTEAEGGKQSKKDGNITRWPKIALDNHDKPKDGRKSGREDILKKKEVIAVEAKSKAKKSMKRSN